MKRDYPDHPFRLSHSTIAKLGDCARLFQLDRLLEGEGGDWKGSPATNGGKAFGAGIQHYIAFGDWDRALLECWLVYNTAQQDPPLHSLYRTINNMHVAKEYVDRLMQDYEVAVFNGKPAIELAFKLRFDDKWYYGGSIDVVLRHRQTGMYLVLEVKTTSYNLVDLQPMYKYSGQALGYSIVIDAIAGEAQASYGVLYFVCRNHPKNFVPDIYVWPMKKTLLDRLNWFISLGLTHEHIVRMDTLGIWPLSGNCVRFGKVCYHYGTCSLTSGDIPKEGTTDLTPYDFEYDLQAVIDNHLERLGNGNNAEEQSTTTGSSTIAADTGADTTASELINLD